MTAYWLYTRLGVHVATSDAELMTALDSYADEHIQGGSAVLTDKHRELIRREHDDAFLLYGVVMNGHCSQ